MAIENVTHAGTSGVTTKAEELRQRALSLLEEIQNESGRAFSVAAAGRVYAEPNAINEAGLFATIEDILTDVAPHRELKNVITELASLATEARHG